MTGPTDEPSEAVARARMLALVAEIREHDELYHDEGRPRITDSAYDALVRELRAIEERHPDWVLPDSPTRRVGTAPRSRAFAKMAHAVPMLSLDSLTDEAAVREADARVRKGLELDEGVELTYVCEPKYDGVSASLLYEAGVLVRGLTRGDGREGEDITRNLRLVRDVPAELSGPKSSLPEHVELRGEVILPRARFAEIRADQEAAGIEPFRNARNAVAGALKRIEAEGIAELGMEFIFWGVGELEGLDELRSYADLVERVAAFGLTVSPLLETRSGVDQILAYHDELEARRDEIDYEMDGVVAKVDDLAWQRRLGRTARAPRWAMAHKFAPRRGRTKVVAIRVQVGRTGALTPVADLEPVEIAGVLVQRASLHNFGLLSERDVRVSDVVDVERAGDVIPEVVEVLVDERKRGTRRFVAPTRCPVCDEAVEEEGAFLYCTNIDCPAQLRQRIVHLAQRRALDVDRLGPKYVDQLCEAGLVERVEDVFRLAERRDEILALERWGEQSFANLAREIEAAKRPELARFLFALGIRQVGERVAADLAEAFGSFEALREAEVEQLCEVEGVGPKVAAEIRAFFEHPANRRFLAEIVEAGVRPRSVEATVAGGGALTGRVFCFTGGLETMTRDQARERVERLGASTVAGISKRVTDVVAGSAAGSKAEKAAKLGLRVLSEEEFTRLLAAAGARGEA